MATDSQVPAFEAIGNFRDCGGYRTADGRLFRTGRLYRSAHFPNATDEDLRRMEALGIDVIVDLRRPTERETYPSRRLPGSRARVIERDGGAVETPPHLTAFAEAGGSAEAAATAMHHIYREIPFEPVIVDLYRDFFAALAEADGAVLIHCAAGKDRTGIAVALAHHLAGVREDDMFANYMETNRRTLDPVMVQGLRERLGQEGRTVCDDAITTVLTVVPGFLGSAFESIETRCGSRDTYLEEVIGISPRQRAAIVDRLTVAPE